MEAKEIKPEMKKDSAEKEKSQTQKAEARKPEVKNKEAKTVVFARGKDLPISKKHSMAICKFMKNKKIDYMTGFLQDVIKLKKAVPMKGEIPHRHNLGTGRYPVKASKVFIDLLRNLRANATAANMDIDKIFLQAKADKASRPRKPGKYHRRFKRTHVEIRGELRK